MLTRKLYRYDIIQFHPDTPDGHHTFTVVDEASTMRNAEKKAFDLIECFPDKDFGFIPVQRMRAVNKTPIKQRVTDRIKRITDRIPRVRISVDRRLPS